MATFGQPSAPSQVTTNLDSVFATSLANYRKTIIDNIGASNAFLFDLMKSDMYESAEGGTYLAEDLMYALTPSQSYDGYDTLPDTPTDGITQVLYEWRQQATPISYSMREVIQNKQMLVNLVKSRIKQGEMGIQEGFAQAMWWGAAATGGNIYDQQINPSNGSLNIEPIPRLVGFSLPANTVIGNLNETTNAWWKNRQATSVATTYSQLLYEALSMYNRCSLGTGGPVTHMITDQVTWQNLTHAYFKVYKDAQDTPAQEYPFVYKKFMNAKVIMDDKVPDAFSNAIGTLSAGEVDPTTLTYGTIYFLNQNFFRVRYYPGRDFTMLEDENGKTFQKPINGDSRLGHIAWMGNLTINNRRKHGVLAKIARTLTD